MAVTTVTTTYNGVVTSFATYCPLSSTKTEDNITTIITITSCSDNKCSEITATTGVTVVTSTKDGIATTYTTYCPLLSESNSSSKAEANTKAETDTKAEISSFSNSSITTKDTFYKGSAQRLEAGIFAFIVLLI